MIVWCGLSNKIDTRPLDENTKSGKLISIIEKEIGITGIRTNLVKYPPLDDNGKLRYPTKTEMQEALPYLLDEIKNAKCIFLLGDKVAHTFENRYSVKFDKYTSITIDGKCFVKIDHPSYIAVYKPKEIPVYVKAIFDVLSSIK